MSILSIISTVVFYKKVGNIAENTGALLSIIIGVPFFHSLWYLLWCVVAKFGASI